MTAMHAAMHQTAENLCARLARIDGFEPDLALRNLHGRQLMLERVLRRFASTYRDGVPVLLDATGPEHELIARWRLACHSLRGALQTVGARALGAQVAELEQEMRGLGSRASFIANARQLHHAVFELARSMIRELS